MHGERWWAAAGDLLLGAVCPGCRTPWWGLCPGCRTQLAGRRPFVAVPGEDPDGAPLTVACSPYDELVSHLVSAHKERGALGLAPVLAGPLALGVAALLQDRGTPGPVLLVPVPSAAAAVRRRGYDATATLATRAARLLRPRWDIRAVALLRQRAGVQDQAGLGAVERRRNLDGALRVRTRPGGAASRYRSRRAVAVLVDDVVTTGSSLAEARRVLARAGVPVLGAATVAAARGRSDAAGADQDGTRRAAGTRPDHAVDPAVDATEDKV